MESLMALKDPVPFTPNVETYLDKEHEVVDGLNDAFDVILKRTSEDYGHAVRSVHAKSHGILRGEMIVEDGLSKELAQGLFARPGRHDAYMRMSTNAGDILPDNISLPRGLALKVFNVPGERLQGAVGNTQDFVMVNGPVFQAPTAEKFLGNLKLLAKTTDRFEGTKQALSSLLRGISGALGSVGIHSNSINSIGGAPNVDPLGETYYSTTPFRYGSYIAKFSIKPISQSLTALTGRIIDASDQPNAIRDTVQGEMQVIDGSWEFCVQLCRDLEKQPVEDPTVLWDEADAPFQRVAIINVRAQDSWDPKTVQIVNEEMRFSVWTGLAAHQPLGNINRARKGTYRHSADFRASFNRCPFHEETAAMLKPDISGQSVG
jgi:hypothetical protein